MEKDCSSPDLMVRYLDPVRRFATYLARTDLDPDDLVGEAMLAGVKRARSGPRPDRWTTWFNGVVRNLVRRRIRERVRGRKTWSGEEEGFVEDPLQNIHREEMRDQLKQAIVQLPPGPRAVFELALQGCSRIQIAHRLNLNLAAVHARWSRGLRFLRSR